MKIDEACTEIQRIVIDSDQSFWGGGILAVLARMQAHRDERFRRLRELDRRASAARWSETTAHSKVGRAAARQRAAACESQIRTIEVELGLRKADG